MPIRKPDVTELPDGSVVETFMPAKDGLSVFLTSPVYKWPGHERWLISMKQTAQHLRSKGIQVVEFYEIGDAMVERSRNTILATHLLFPPGTFTHHIQMDCDISFHPSAIEALIRNGKDATGGAYAFKCDKDSPKWGTPVNRPFGLEDQVKLRDPEQQHLVPARYLGGGCTIITDTLIRRLIAAYPELYYNSNPTLNGGVRLHCWGLWRSDIIEQPQWPAMPNPHGLPVPTDSGMELLSEDYAFCQRVLDVHNRDGGERVICWIDPYVHLSHWVGDVCYDLDYFEDINKARLMAVDPDEVEVVAVEEDASQ